jgi:hypothetical protein
MFYHFRPLKYVVYGKVGPPPIEAVDPHFALAYEWLGQYCGYWPQVWLARSRSAITGFRWARKKNRPPDGVLFGFDYIKGFPVAYDFWCDLLFPLINSKGLEAANVAVPRYLEWMSSEADLADDPPFRTWMESQDLDEVLRRHLFVEHDQVVVPALNLKAAKHIICRTEKQKKALRRMGFIEDRIEIKNVTTW